MSAEDYNPALNAYQRLLQPPRPSAVQGEAPSASADAVQHGGTHYKKFKYETWNVILDWELGYLDGNAVKYLSRWRNKGGVQDLKKAAHYIQKLIEVEEANGNPGK